MSQTPPSNSPKPANSADILSSFDSVPLRGEILATAKALGYTVMTPVQSQSLPTLIEGRDLIAQAKTGSGKTAAFAPPQDPTIDCEEVVAELELSQLFWGKIIPGIGRLVRGVTPMVGHTLESFSLHRAMMRPSI